MQVVRRNARNSSVNRVSTSNIADNRLRQAVDRFDIFKAKLKQLRHALSAHHANLVHVESSRCSLVNALMEVSADNSDSPILDLVRGEDPPSYAAVHAENSRDMKGRLKEYQVEIISYLARWEGTVTTRIATELKHLDRLYKNFARYHNKVESLKAAADKKKTLKDTDIEKITRNESKLRTARKEYRRNLVSITLLTEECTERGWTDLLPLLMRIINFDMESSLAVSDRMSRLAEVRKEMESLAKRFEIDEDVLFYGRIETLLEDDAMEFVRPEHREDIESIQASVASYVPPADRVGSRVSGVKQPSETEEEIYEDSPNNSDDDSYCPTDEKKGTVSQVHPSVECSSKGVEVNTKAATVNSTPAQGPKDTLVMKIVENKPVYTYAKKPTAPHETDVHTHEDGSIINYPTSIYFEGDVHHLDDDETTLTPYPDMASV
jgi:hypothetical protein